MNGIIIVNKPKNYTSFDVIARLRKKLGQKKIGHMGTLDPMATGVLPILLGKTAKFQIYSCDNQKGYIAKIQFGITTDTLDITGKITSKKPFLIDEEKIKNAIQKFTGKISQVPPMFSAIKQDGKKLCDLARKGIEVERKPRKIEIKSIQILDLNEKLGTLTLKIICSKGTYIRSLCSDIGGFLGCGAVLTDLERIYSNGFDISQSAELDTILNSTLEEIKSKYLLPTEYLFKDKQSVNISEPQAKRFQNGGSLMLERIKSPCPFKNDEIYKILCDNNFVGLGKADLEKNEMHILKCLHSAE
ncbi:MAG: tRNA pseudouridine(55) synthase TruB [Clostridia bacterium]|nr:tRNA pseudouridine(55) synthase TruB [Clostridia bacterium]